MALGAALPLTGIALGGVGEAGASRSHASGGTIQVGVIGPMTGSGAEIGQLMSASCAAGVYAVNKAGGVMGSKLACDAVDDYGDPADAVPAVTKALATTSNLKMAVGLESTTAATTIPIVNNAHIPMFSTDGLVAFDKTNDKYFWRTTAADNQNGAAFALWAVRKGWKRDALVFETSIGDSGNIPGVIQALHHRGGKVVGNYSIPGDQSTYSSVVARVIAGHPQAIIAAMDPQTAATFFSEYKQLNHGKVPPIVTSTESLTPQYMNAMDKVVGKGFVVKKIALLGGYISPKSLAYHRYSFAMHHAPGVKKPSLVLGVGVISAIYDGIQVMSLAMTEAHSTSGSVYNNYIRRITSPGPKATIVHTYAQGLAALRHHKRIDYVGVEGQITFDKHHNSPGNFSATGFNANGSPRFLGEIPGREVQKALS